MEIDIENTSHSYLPVYCDSCEQVYTEIIEDDDASNLLERNSELNLDIIEYELEANCTNCEHSFEYHQIHGINTDPHEDNTEEQQQLLAELNNAIENGNLEEYYPDQR